MAKPFLKWVGGKRSKMAAIMATIEEECPDGWHTYYEPMVGGGAVFWHLEESGMLTPRYRWPANMRELDADGFPTEYELTDDDNLDKARAPAAVLMDANPDLINAYREIRENCPEVMAWLDDFEEICGEGDKRKRFYYWLRNRATPEGDAWKAARFIWLNKRCFNGLYRTNASGQFNVPYGDNKGAVFDPSALRACSRALRPVLLLCKSFDERHGPNKFFLEQWSGPGDLFYFDPPYVPIKHDSFVSYTKHGFDWDDQVRLRQLADALLDKGAYVVLSNSSAPAVYELWEDERWKIRGVSVTRSVGAAAKTRVKAKDVLITPNW